jgi:haloalkane dehalogenase
MTTGQNTIKKAVDISRFQHLYPFASHYMNRKGHRYHFIDEGDGEPVIMLHGNPTWSFYYRALIKALSSDFRTIVPDHIGCGLSDKPRANAYDYKLKSRVDDLEALLVNLQVYQDITLVLHDWGGFIGMAFALMHPDAVRRLIIMNTAAFLPPAGKPVPALLRLVRVLKPLAVPAILGLNLFAYSAAFMAAYKPLAKDVRSALLAPYNCWQNRIATLKFVQDIDLSENNPSYHIVKETDRQLHRFSNLPTLICWGDHDFIFDLDYLHEWQRRFPGAEVHRFPDAGHYVLEDVPRKIVPLAKQFLKRHAC